MAHSHSNGAGRWTRPLLYLVSGFLLFETLTGLLIWLLPFGIASQIMILVHTAIGLLFMIPYAWYQIRHWREYRSRPMSDVKLSGYLAMGAVVVAIVSGLILTWQAAFGIRTESLWRNIHLISTFVFVIAAVPHVGLIVLRDRRAASRDPVRQRLEAEKQFGFNSSFIVLMQFVLVGLFMFAYQPPSLEQPFPDYYQYHQDSDNPFGPSLARTADGELIHAELLGGSQSCGTAGCHGEIYEEWEASAHRYAAADPFFREIQREMGEQKGPVSTRYCAGCHDPVGLFSGSANLFSDELTDPIGINEGVSCISCHAITEADIQGNADFVIEAPDRYMFELHDGELAKWVSDFLIRSYPRQHVESFQRPLFKTSEYCGACHKQYLDEDINDIGWVQLQNQYDNWRESHWFEPDSPITTVECRECHMPLKDSTDPSSGDRFAHVDYNRSSDDGKHRSHRFLGANQVVPEVLDLPNADEHVRLTEKWLRGEYEIPEIEHKWETGPVVPVRLMVPDAVSPGEEMVMEVVLTNNKAGHDFPTGPLDMIQAWLEVTVSDSGGRTLFTSGTLDEDHFIEPGAFMFRAEPVDQFGNLIDRHNLWEMVGVRHSRALFPGRSDYTSYSYQMDESLEPGEELNITVRLLYRKMNQYLMNEMFREVTGLETAPVTVVSEDSATIRVAEPGQTGEVSETGRAGP